MRLIKCMRFVQYWILNISDRWIWNQMQNIILCMSVFPETYEHLPKMLILLGILFVCLASVRNALRPNRKDEQRLNIETFGFSAASHYRHHYFQLYSGGNYFGNNQTRRNFSYPRCYSGRGGYQTARLTVWQPSLCWFYCTTRIFFVIFKWVFGLFIFHKLTVAKMAA